MPRHKKDIQKYNITVTVGAEMFAMMELELHFFNNENNTILTMEEFLVKTFKDYSRKRMGVRKARLTRFKQRYK